MSNAAWVVSCSFLMANKEWGTLMSGMRTAWQQPTFKGFLPTLGWVIGSSFSANQIPDDFCQVLRVHTFREVGGLPWLAPFGIWGDGYQWCKLLLRSLHLPVIQNLGCVYGLGTLWEDVPDSFRWNGQQDDTTSYLDFNIYNIRVLQSTLSKLYKAFVIAFGNKALLGH